MKTRILYLSTQIQKGIVYRKNGFNAGIKIFLCTNINDQ